jgi:hypothetical protein
MRDSYYTRQDLRVPELQRAWANRARKLTTGLLSSAIRKGADFNQLDAEGRIPLLSFAELVSAQRNMLSMGSFAELATGTSSKRIPPNWGLTDAQGNTALHLLFSRAPKPMLWGQKHARRGATVQEFAQSLCRDTAAAKAVLSEVDLLSLNKEGDSIIRLITHHCLHPHSRRADEDRFAYRYHGLHWAGAGDPIMSPERFPNCLHTHEKLYAAWMQMRTPLVKSVSENQPPPSASIEPNGGLIPFVCMFHSFLVHATAGASSKRI